MMSVTPHRETAPELPLRTELRRRGLRHRVEMPLPDRQSLRADLLFGPSEVAVFVDLCCRHGCPEHFTVPKSNPQWWLENAGSNCRRVARLIGIFSRSAYCRFAGGSTRTSGARLIV